MDLHNTTQPLDTRLDLFSSPGYSWWAGLYDGELIKTWRNHENVRIWKIGTFNWRITVAKRLIITLPGTWWRIYEFHAFHDFQLHIHGLAVKLKNNNHLQENLRFARNSRIWVDLIRVLQWRLVDFTQSWSSGGILEFPSQT